MTIKAIEVHNTILFTPSMHEPQSLADVLEDFCIALPRMAPQRWALGEPINKEIDFSLMRQTLVSTGNRDLLWRRRDSPRGWGVLRKRTNPRYGPQHARHYFMLSARSNAEVMEYVKYLQHAATRFGADYACCDTIAPMYRAAAIQNELAPYENLSVYTHMLTRSLPDVVWAQIFGPAYIALFGLDSLMSAPAWKVERLTSDLVYMQLTSSLFDMYAQYEEVERIRQRVKEHIDKNIIYRPDLPADHAYVTPKFQFPT